MRCSRRRDDADGMEKAVHHDIIGTAAAPFGAYWLATRFGIGW